MFNVEIPLKNIQEYLNIKGFQIETFDENLDKVKIQEDGEFFDIVLPKKENLIDYNRRILDFIQTISSIEKRGLEEVKDNLLNINYDLLKFRFQANTTKEGNIPLIGYNSIIKGIEDVMVYGACSVILPKSQYTRPYDEAKELVKHCEIGQTEKGSFIITVRVPIKEDFFSPESREEEEFLKNFGRKTINQIISGIQELKSMSLDSEDSFRDNYDEKLSKNVCDALSGMIQQEIDFNVDINAKLNTFIQEEGNISTEVKIESDSDFQKFNLASSYLKKIPEEKIMTITGLIIRLNDNPQQKPDDRKLITLTDSKLKRNIYIRLNNEDYKNACEAHGEGKNISITGLLNKKQSHWCLDNPEGFKIIEN